MSVRTEPMKHSKKVNNTNPDSFNNHLERKTKHKHNSNLVRGQRASKRALQASYNTPVDNY